MCVYKYITPLAKHMPCEYCSIRIRRRYEPKCLFRFWRLSWSCSLSILSPSSSLGWSSFRHRIVTQSSATVNVIVIVIVGGVLSSHPVT